MVLKTNKSNKNNKPAKKLSNHIKSRKEKRKEKRQEKKIKRRTHQSVIKESRDKLKSKSAGRVVPGTASEIGKFVKRIGQTTTVNDDVTSEIESDFSLSDEETNQKMKKIAEQSKPPKTSYISTAELMWQKEKESEKKLQKKFSKVRVQQLKLANKDEDKIIKKLEKKLGIDKKPKGSIPKFNDGLDELLELCTTDKVNELFEKSKKRKRIGFAETFNSDLEDDFEDITNGKPKQKVTSDEEEHDDSADDSEVSEKDNKADVINYENSSDDVSDDDESGDQQQNFDGDSNENEEDHEVHSESENEKKFTQTHTDIYGRELNELGKVVQDNKQKYIPPHLKNRNPADDEKLMRLKRQLKGQINRLTEVNLPKIAKEIENMYMHNSRHDMNSILTILIFDALVTNVLAPERTVLEHLLLLGALHANIGCEVGAYFLEKIVEQFDEHLEKIMVTEIENKHLDNIVQIICHLYTFKIISQQLIFEIIHKLIMQLNEKVVECVLIILRSIGFTLRKDDPTALKDLIVCMQKQANEEIAKAGDNLRLKFMLDVLLAIKNNNMKKIPQYDPELAEQLKKQLKALCINGKYVTTLNIALNDLLNVHERGKWWVIGSAWTGSNTIKGSGSKLLPATEKDSFSQKLLDLARQQRMNTDEKRLLFCTIMSAEDYLEAFEKLMHIKIKDFNILTSIIIHCCLAENDYNPYYAILGQKLCDYDRKYQLALKFSIWDKIHNIETLNSSQITNFSKFITYLIKESGLALSILKVIQFSELDKISLKLVRKIMIGILLVGEEEQFTQIFKRISPSVQLKTFKDGLRLFMEHFLLRASIQSGLKDSEKILLKKRIKLADSILASSISNIL